ncbi:hypothetical protein ACP4OV_009168 [Aristida adscensionis]
MGDGGLCELLVGDHCGELRHVSDAEDLFSILETWEECMNGGGGGAAPAYSHSFTGGGDMGGARPTGNGRRRSGDEKGGGARAPVQKKQKAVSYVPAPDAAAVDDDDDGAAKMSHITVERNRRKQMNEHLAVLRSLMPCFYVKRGDQASIIGGVVDYIKELQQVLRSLEAKKHRKAYADQVLSPRPPPLSPRPLIKSTPPLSPRVAVPISPRTPPTPPSSHKPPAAAAGRLPPAAAAAAAAMTPTSSSSSYSYEQQAHYSPQPYLPTLDSLVTELAAQAARPAAAGLVLPSVKVEFAGPNLVLKTVSHRSPAQALRIIALLESLSLEILHVSVTTVDDTMVHSFTIKIGIECELSAEELVQEIQQTLL